MMRTLKNMWRDFWYGRWEVQRVFSHYRPQVNFGLASIKAEGSYVEYDNGIVYDYYIVHHQAGHPHEFNPRILCAGYREAVLLADWYNRMRGFGI